MRKIMWANPGEPTTEVEQAPSTPSFSKNQFNSGPAMQDKSDIKLIRIDKNLFSKCLRNTQFGYNNECQW